ncbi:MAG: DUF4202 domain-containing protein [Candidatus Moranbacteria bacterium]|nr:DUF4202 domain-containing protein [Candidatus Moranbacteria bacterium]
MENEYYNAVVKFVDESFGRKHPHFERTMYWLREFMPEATEVHLIAAYGHDIARAFDGEGASESYLDTEHLQRHQERGAEILSDFLLKNGAPVELAENVAHLVSRHEWGGDEEQDLLRDADSVSFLETNAEGFVMKKAQVEGYEKIREKLDWMFDRIGSEERKEYARENYEKWSSLLETAK